MAGSNVARKQTAQDMEERFMSVCETAVTFDCSEPTIYRLIAAGRIPALRAGRGIKVPRAWVKEREAAALRGEPVVL
jgi:excisionase family DNA binding protein